MFNLFLYLMRNAIWIIFFVTLNIQSFSQTIPIQHYSTNQFGQVQIEINSTSDKYYILKAKHHIDSSFSIFASMTLGKSGKTILSEPLKSYPQSHYQVEEFSIQTPNDIDNDGIDDVTEFNGIPFKNPFNFAPSIDISNGLVVINNFETFDQLAFQQDFVPFVPYLNGKKYLKFIIYEFPSAERKLYFINTKKYDLHETFANFIGMSHLGINVIKGQIIYHPNIISSNGTLGTFTFNYTNNESKSFKIVQQTQELLAANMPFLANNFSYFVTQENEDDYFTEQNDFNNSRTSVLFETNIFAGLNYWGLNQKEGFGLFHKIELGETPGPKDIVLYDYLPNTLPRIGGIITSVIQTPLSHVNLRAIHDEIPNAFIKNPLDNDTIKNLLNHYIYFKVEQSKYTIREATIQEVNNWYETNRPLQEQLPPLNLDYKKITPLDQITFDMYDGFGAKCANVATMRRFGFEEGTIPNGFGIPFYFYQEFMKHNHFFDEIKTIIKTPNFDFDRNLRDSLLTIFRAKISKASIPDWMQTAFFDLQNSFPKNSSIRCRSTTNNEDLPGFSGAGLYDSKTHHDDEGNLSKTVKQVYASIWNLRAFEEREYYKINHFQTSMGVLCHANFENEKVNGVGVSADPVYGTKETYYLNSQLGEELITNPENSKPEELILNNKDHIVIQYSSLVAKDSLLMNDSQINQLRDYLKIIHHNFEKLYHAENNKTFAMDIEFKIAKNNQLIIKQARPWVSFIHKKVTVPEKNSMLIFPNPSEDYINITCDNCKLYKLYIYDLTGKKLDEKILNQTGSSNSHIDISLLPKGLYLLKAVNDYDDIVDYGKFMKN